MDRSRTLNEAEPVHTEPARSQHWVEQAEEHEHTMLDDHNRELDEHDHNDHGSVPDPPSHDAHEHDHHQHDHE